MTEELFRNNAYLKTCDATITAVGEDSLVLDQTVFYPEGGGQPGDRGILYSTSGQTLTVVDTLRAGDGSISHVLEAGSVVPPVGIGIRGDINWDRRYQYMRTHTCLHLLCSLIPFPVTGGSISQDKGRLDFDMRDPVDKESVQAQLQQLINADHAVSFRWISDVEMSHNMDLVRTMSVTPPMGQGRVRLVDVNGIDLQPCGGTHVSRTGEIGRVRIGKVEKKGKHNRRVNLHLG